MKSLSLVALLSLSMALPGAALAQSLQTEPQSRQAAPSAPAAPPSAAPGEGSSNAPGSLSGALSRSQGVIQPPPTGDSGVVPTPNPGAASTPVIPPPGTPGGNPQVQPK